MLLLELHAASSWPLSDFSSRNVGWSLCQPTASHLKCPLCLSVFLPPVSGRKQAECPGTLLSSGVYLSVIKLSVFSFSRRTQSVPEYLGSLCPNWQSVMLWFESVPQKSTVGHTPIFVFMVFQLGPLRGQG